ncbi:WD repeat-containing protein 41 isoform X3 [Syngnathoides biaculeatus]|uniref:WD repeat-containing protein 41 isoform X3 n=1 Tax=Syngnathoides biaculeatus TaxID=300417 RepID=UPI002ADD74D1|nr:WD repeat-containing protein 41 isoform X3 [Syngnathoides biaculeatus]XP_061658072.1 WD repeat-containing protein 41 isoform X3 [Syngnathoides biaculeatus]XP_061658073.1 WD repeat-containing protein 41 isoform X3 [Syngnathoides biaculeatus]
MRVGRGRRPGADLERGDGRASAGAPRSLAADHRRGGPASRRRPPRHRLLRSHCQPVGPRHRKQAAHRSGPSVVRQVHPGAADRGHVDVRRRPVVRLERRAAPALRRRDAPTRISSLIELPDDRVAAAVERRLVIYKLTAHGDALTVVEVGCQADHRDHIRALVNVNDRVFASGSLAGEIILWDALDCSVLAYQRILWEEPESATMAHEPVETSVRHLASNGNLVAAAVGSGVYVLSAATGAALAYRKRAHDSDVLHTALLSDSELMSCSEDGSVRMWDIRELPLAAEPASAGFFGMWTSARSSKQTCAPSKKSPEPPAVRTLELTGDLIGHSGAVQMFLAFPENGLLTCSADRQLILWKNGERQSRLRGLALFRKLEENGGL